MVARGFEIQSDLIRGGCFPRHWGKRGAVHGARPGPGAGRVARGVARAANGSARIRRRGSLTWRDPRDVCFF